MFILMLSELFSLVLALHIKNILCQSNCINNRHKHEKLSTVSCEYNTSLHERVTFRSAGVQIVHTSILINTNVCETLDRAKLLSILSV